MKIETAIVSVIEIVSALATPARADLLKSELIGINSSFSQTTIDHIEMVNVIRTNKDLDYRVDVFNAYSYEVMNLEIHCDSTKGGTIPRSKFRITSQYRLDRCNKIVKKANARYADMMRDLNELNGFNLGVN